MRVLRRVLPDRHDATAITGIGLLFGGCWWIYPPSALIVVGAVLTTLAIVSAR